MYILFRKDVGGFGYAYWFGNRRVLADFLGEGITYSKLTYHFTRANKTWIELDGDMIIRIKKRNSFKGAQGGKDNSGRFTKG